jgi:hypothetical protein
MGQFDRLGLGDMGGSIDQALGALRLDGRRRGWRAHQPVQNGDLPANIPPVGVFHRKSAGMTVRPASKRA